MGKFAFVHYLRLTLVSPGESQARVQALVTAIAQDVKASIFKHMGITLNQGHAQRVVLGTGDRHIAHATLKLTPVIQEGTQPAAARQAFRQASLLAQNLQAAYRGSYSYDLTVAVILEPTDDDLASVV